MKCFVFVKDASSSNKVLINLLNSNKQVTVFHHFIGTKDVYNKKMKIQIDNIRDALVDLDIDFIIVKCDKKDEPEINTLIHEMKKKKTIDCFTNICIACPFIRIHTNCEISYIYKTLQLCPSRTPIQSIQPQKMGPSISKELSQFSEICMSFMECLEDVQKKDIPKYSIHEAVYIEFRELPHSECIIKNCIHKLNDTWAHTVVCCEDNYQFTVNMCNKINKNINIITLNLINATYNDYNNLLLSTEFWEMLHGEKILIYQSDSFIFNTNIDDFLQYDYIGTPFISKTCIAAEHPVGNGGLSLRTKQVMLDVLVHPNCDKKYSKIAEKFKQYSKLDKIHEDIYFSQNIQNLKLGRVAEEEAGKQFGIRNQYDDTSFGMHAIWHNCIDWKSVLQKHMKKGFTIASKGDDNLSKMNKFCDKMHMTREEVLSNPKNEYHYVCYCNLDYMRMMELAVVPNNSELEAVLIEFRCLPHLEFLLRNCIYKLGNKWSQTVVCGKKNYHYLVNIVKHIGRDIRIIKLDYENLTQMEYNDLLFTPEFWNSFVGEKLLIYQEDTCVFKSNIDAFLQWDYIGALWPLEYGISKSGVGNGGFSLRTKKVMLECLTHDENIELSKVTERYMKENALKRIPEDVFFANTMELHSIGKIADHDTAKHFSSESFTTDSFGGHQFWLNNPTWKNMVYKNGLKTFECTSTLKIEHRGGWSNVIHRLHETNIYRKGSNIVFYDIVEQHFIWEQTQLNKKWFGVIHCTENTPPYLNIVNIQKLFTPNSHFLKHIHNCLFLICLSPNVVDYVNKKLGEVGAKVNVYLLEHPIDKEDNMPMFSMDKYLKNEDKKIIQIGQQLRKMTSIYVLDSINEHTKLWLTGTKNINKLTHLFYEECKYLEVTVRMNEVETKYTDTFSEYDRLLSENIVFIDLFDAAANNTVLECILRRTPIIVTRLPATVYYLGENYPLFFNDLNEVPGLLTVENIQKAHEYLANVVVSDTNEFITRIVHLLN